MSVAKRDLNLIRRVSPAENKTEITCSFGATLNLLSYVSWEYDVFNPRDTLRLIQFDHVSQHPSALNMNHHDAGCQSLTMYLMYIFANRVPDDQSFKVNVVVELQGKRAQDADRVRGDFDYPR